jgi:hypothetical protein
MAATKRNKLEIIRDRIIIAELHLKGKTQMEILAKLNGDKSRGYTLSQPIISYDLAAIHAEWSVQCIQNYHEAKAVELAKINHLEREYWQAWERSQTSRTTSRSRKEEVTGKSKQSGEIQKEELLGDHRYLQGVQWCIERRCELLGLDAPKQMHISNTNLDKIPFGQLTKDQLNRLANGEDPSEVIPGFSIN